MSLAREASSISLLEIVNAVEPIPRILSCPLDLPTHQLRLCPLHRKLDEAHALVEQSFATTTLGDLIATIDSDPTSLHFPEPGGA